MERFVSHGTNVPIIVSSENNESKNSNSESFIVFVAEGDVDNNSLIGEKQSLRSLSNRNMSPIPKKKNPVRKLKSNLNASHIEIKTPRKSDSVGVIKRGRQRRRLSMNNSDNNMEMNSKLNRSDDMSATFFASSGSLGFVRRTPRKEEESESTPKNVKPKKKFISPIDKLLKKNGSLVEALSTSNHTDEENDTTDSYHEIVNVNENVAKNRNSQHFEEEEEMKLNFENIRVLTKVPVDAFEEIKELSSVKFSDNHSENHNEDVIGVMALAKSPSAFSTDSAKGSSITNEGSWLTFNVGDLFWGKIYNFCFWPCMACNDPDSENLVKDEVSRSGERSTLIHVRFFADNGRRNWVRRENLIPFISLENYMEHVEDAKEKYGKKSLRVKVFLPSKRKETLWHQAINEAQSVAETPYADRLKKFHQIFERSKLFQNVEKERRKSMNVYRARFALDTLRRYDFNDAIDVESTSENFNNQQLHNFSEKRDRSSSPFSEAYSPHEANFVKRRRLSNGVELKKNNNNNDLVNLNNFLRDFVLGKNRDEALERSVSAAARDIFTLREMNRARQQLLKNTNENISDSSMVEGLRPIDDGVTKKRLSNRLKNLVRQKGISMRQSPEMVANASKAKQSDSSTTEKVVRKIHNRSIEEVINDIFELDNKYLFRGMSRDPVCKYCFKPGHNLKKCSKVCQQWLHKECLLSKISTNVNSKQQPKTSVTNTKVPNKSVISPKAIAEAPIVAENPEIDTETESFTGEPICHECSNNEPLRCLICNNSKSQREDDPLVTCSMQHCERAFHPACCKYWPQAKWTISKNHIESCRCPSHVCHTCVSDDPREKFQQLGNTKIVKCVKCPATYHCDSTCIPAGSQILTAAYIICPCHTNSKSDMIVNVNWCFICVTGGQLVCCETCPTAVHAQCLKMPIDNNAVYICEECESGRKPLYGEIVWAKFNNFRWWPAVILPPPLVPQNIAKKSHNESDFVVRFFGTHDHGWISRRRVYLYVEGDCSEPPKMKSYLDGRYTKGVEEARRVFEVIKSKKLQLRLQNKDKLHPQPYVRIKTNRAVPPVKLHVNIEKLSRCNCLATDENPCGPYSNCLNRVLFNECSPKICRAGERCQNQMFESRISPRLDVVHMKERGFGLLCREFIPAGSFVIEYVGEVINDNEFKARLTQKTKDRDENFYFLSVEKDYIIDAGPRGNLARFMNHSCNPNCETQKWVVNSLLRIGVFAIKDIPADTELTFNYHWDDLMGNKKKTCLCGSKNCSGHIGGKPKEFIDLNDKESSITSVNISSRSKTTVTRSKASRKRSRKSKTNLRTEPEINDQEQQVVVSSE
uniref:Histone-lysine N-methyltransferase n=1 Tax=Glossina brevipalpis TaxID=37001 RepID=A0A1A9WY31_9MUSC